MSGGLFSSSHSSYTSGHSGFTGGVSNFVSAIFGIFASLLQSVLGLVQAFFGLAANVINSAFAIVKHFVIMVTDAFSGVVGFVAGAYMQLWWCKDGYTDAFGLGNFVAIAVCVGAYFAWTTYQKRNGGRRPIANNTRSKAH